MAFQPTRTRSVNVRPTGTASSQGLLNTAQTLSSVSRLTGSVADSLRANDLADATLQAEIDGKTNGAIFVDGKLQPLTNVSYDVGNLPPRDAKLVADAYKTSAFNTYLSALANDAKTSADKSYHEAPTNPSAVGKAGVGYIEGMVEAGVPQDVIDMAQPQIEAYFASAKNRAFAGQQQLARENTLGIKSERLGNLTSEAASIVASGALNVPHQETGASARLAQINAERDQLHQELIEEGLTTQALVNKSNRVHQTTVQSRAASIHISDVIGSEGFTSALEEIRTTRLMLQDDTSVDVEVITSEMEAVFNRAVKIKTSQKADEQTLFKTNYGTTYLGIVTGQITSIEEFAHLEMGPTQRGGLIDVLNGRSTAAVNKQNKINADQSELLITQWKNPEFFGMSREDATINMVGAIRAGTVSPQKMDEFLSLQRTEFTELTKAGNVGAFANLDLSMSDLGGYLQPPSFYLGMTEDLMKMGIVGDTSEGAAISLLSWQDKISSYQGRYKSESRKRTQTNRIMTKVDQGIVLSSEDITHLDNNGLIPSHVSVINAEGVEETVEMDISHPDPTIASASRDAAISWSAQTGALHPKITDQLRNAEWLDDDAPFNQTLELHSQFTRTLKSLGKTDNYIERLMENAGIDTSILNSDTRFVGREGTQNLISLKSKGGSRRLNEIIPSAGLVDEDEFVDAQLSKAFPADSLAFDLLEIVTAGLPFDFSDENVSPADSRMVSLLQDASEGELVDLIKNTPTLMNQITVGAKADIVAGKYTSNETGFQTALRSNLRKAFDVWGVEETGDGDLRLTRYPVLAQAQGTASDFPDVTLTMDDIHQNITDIVFANPILTDGGFAAEAFANEDYVISVNSTFGGKPTYSVSVELADGTLVPVLPNYQYNFKKSAQYDAFNQAMDEIKSKPLKRMMASLPLLDDTVMRSTYNVINSNARDQTWLQELTHAYNRAGYSFFGFGNFDPAEIPSDDFRRARQYFLSLGIR